MLLKMTRYIAIDGPGGSGKTYISEILAAHMNATVFHLDDYGDDFKPFIGIPALVKDLQKSTEEIVIYEGVGVFDPRLDDFNATRIFVSTPERMRADRAAKRDVPRKGRTEEDWRKIYAIWEEAEKSYFTSELIDSADLLVNNDDDVNVELIIQSLHQV